MLLRNYALILLGLIVLLSVNSYYHFNSGKYQQDILDTMTFQMFKDLRAIENKTEEQQNKTKDIVEEYIIELLGYKLDKRNDIADTALFINMTAIIVVMIVAILHFLFLLTKEDNSAFVFRVLIILSSIWILIMFVNFNFIDRFYRIEEFLMFGIVPIILLNGVYWVKKAKLKDTPTQ